MSSLNNEDRIIVDSRFQSYHKCFIVEILNSDLTKFHNYKVVKINKQYVSKVCITGFIVGIFETQKMFRCKIDDSTGKINVTIWKDQLIFAPISVQNEANIETNLNETLFDDDSMTSEEHESNARKNNDIQSLLNSIRTRTNDINLNNSIINRPIQGDLVTIKGYIKCYRNLVELNALSVTRIKKSNEEYIEMMLPMVLDEKCYQLVQKDRILPDNFKSIENNNNNKKPIDEKFLSLVLDRLINLSTAHSTRQPCNSFQLFNHIRDNCTDQKSFTHTDVVDALKLLEMKSLIYSCDNQNSYLPID